MMIFLIRVLAWIAALPYVAVVLLVLTGPPTWSAVAYLAGIGLLIAGLVTLRDTTNTTNTTKQQEHRVFGMRRPRGLTRGALLSLVAIAVVRGCSAREGETLRFSEHPRIVDRLIDEQDIAVSGTRVLVAGGMLQDDADELPSAMRAAYAKMRASEGDAPSPVLATYLGMQSAASTFDLLVIDNNNTAKRNGDSSDTDSAVIFLHGFAGNFNLPCWQMAQAVSPLGYMTACPSTRWVGDWWTAEGEATLQRTVDILHERGVSRIVLAGLSNGGIGASRLITRMPPKSFVGLILISGEDPTAKISPNLPTLVIHGRFDSMTPYFMARDYAAKTGAQLVTIQRGHFAMLVGAEESDRAVRDFISRLDASLPSRSRS